MTDIELHARAITVERVVPASRHPARALDSVDLTIHRGDVVAIMGSTGAGKSTLGQVLAGLVRPTLGRVDGPAAGAVRMVLQRPESTFLESRVDAELGLGPAALGATDAAIERAVGNAAAAVGFDETVLARDPLALSGGEQRRVAVAAVLAMQPRLLVLDEPSAGLDHRARAKLHHTLARVRDGGATLVLVTHDPAEAAELATRLVVLDAGRIVWDGAPATVLGDPAVAQALGIHVTPEVALLHRVCAAHGMATPAVDGRPSTALDALAHVLAGGGVRAARSGAADAPSIARAGSSAPSADATIYLPPMVDARWRMLAAGFGVLAALAAGSLLAAGIVAAAAAAIVASAHIDRARVRLAVRPLIALALTLIGLQLAFGGGSVDVVAGHEAAIPAGAALLRSLQAAAIILITLALSAATAAVDLASALRWWLAPMRALRVPVDALAFVVATALGLVPTLADELERLRLAQRARGLRSDGASPRAGLRADARLLAPLFVAAFRRAHLLADALAVRGIDPARPTSTRPWRSRVVPGNDRVLLAAGIAALLVARWT